MKHFFMRLAVVCVVIAITQAVSAQTPYTSASSRLTTATCTGTGDAETGCVSLAVRGYGSVVIEVTGTWSGTITFEGTIGRASYVTLSATPSNSTTTSTTTTSNGVFSVGVGGLSIVRVRMSSYTSGAAVVSIGASISSARSGIVSLNPSSAPTLGGLFISATNPNVRSLASEHTAVYLKCLTTSLTTTSAFSNEECLTIDHYATMGQNVYGSGTNAKRTFIALKLTAKGYGAGQHNTLQINPTCIGMGDCFALNKQIRFSGADISSDEGTGFETSRLTQVDGPDTTITSVTTPTTCNTTLTQDVNGSPTAQARTVASTTNCVVNDWVVIGRQVATGIPNQEAMKIAAVGGGAITGVFRNNHTSGDAVTPATVLEVNSVENFGQDRVLVNLSATPYTTGTVASYTYKTFTGSGTTWTNTMVGGDALNPGCISRTADDSPYVSWYEINVLASATSLDVFSYSVAGDLTYHGLPGSAAYTVRPCARLLYLSTDADGELDGTVILNTNTFTWTAGQSLHVAVAPYADVTGHFMAVQTYTPGGAYRAGYSLQNQGYRTWGTGYAVDATMAGGGDPIGWYTGFSAESIATGMYVHNPTTGYVINAQTSATTGTLAHRFVADSGGIGLMGIDNATGDMFMGHSNTLAGKELRITSVGNHRGSNVTKLRTHLTIDTSENSLGSPYLPTIHLVGLGGPDLTLSPDEINDVRILTWPNQSGMFALAITGTTGSIGGGSLSVACTSGTATVTGVTTAMALAVTPVAYPGDNVYWNAYMSAADTVTVKVCTTAAAITPTSTTYNVRVIQ